MMSGRTLAADTSVKAKTIAKSGRGDKCNRRRAIGKT
jgi:hypothetical protein